MSIIKFPWEVEEEKEFNEIEFQKAYEEFAIQQGLSEDPDDPRHFYDYRAYYKKYKKFEVDELGHLPSEFKEKGHPREIVGGINTITGEKEEEKSVIKFEWDKPTMIEPTTTMPAIGADTGGATITTLPSQSRIQSLSLKQDYERKTLEQEGVSQRMRGIGEVPKKYPFEGITVELSKATKMRNSLWWNELKAAEDKVKFFRQENWSPELKQADIEVMRLSEEASKAGVNINDWIRTGVYAAYFATLAAGILPIISQVPANILNKISYKVEGKTVKGSELVKTLQKVRYPDPRSGFGAPSVFDKKVFAKFVEEGGIKSLAERMKGITITEVTPRFAFSGKLYSGFPIDEMVKSIVEVGKLTKDISNQLKVMNPVDVGLVFQELSLASPAIASKVATQFVELIPQKITKIPKVEEEMTPGEVEQFEKLKEAKIIPEKEIEPTKVELKEIELTPKEKFMARMEEARAKVVEPTPKVTPKEPIILKEEIVPQLKVEEPPKEIPKVEVKKPVVIEEKVDLATPAQIKKAHAIADTKAMISEKGKVKPQYRAVAKAFTGKTSIKDMTPEEAEMFIDMLNRLPEPKLKNGKLVAPSIPRTMKLTTEDFFKKQYGEPTPIWLLTDQTYYATKLGIKPLVEPFEKGKMEFDLEFRKSSNLVDRMVNKLNSIAKTSAFAKIKSKIKNIPTEAESKMAELVNKYEATPSGLSEKEADVFKYFRNLSKDIWRRENEVREKVDLPPIKYKQAYFRHTADVMAKEMLEGKYPFPQGIKYWGEKMVGKKIFNPMEFHRKLSDDLIDLWSKDIRAVTKAMLWSGLKEIYLAQPAKFLSEQLNAISKDLPEYKNLSPRDQAAYDQTRVIPASTKKWLINYVNQVLKGQETELDASLNRIVTKSGLKGIFDKVLSPFGRSIGRKPITNIFVLSGRAIISGVMGWVPRQITRNSFQPVQNLALYGVKATIKAYLPASVDKNLKELMSESLFRKSYTGFEELPTNIMAKLEKIWLGPYGIVAVNNAKLGMKAAYWNISELIKNPKFKKHGWADPRRTKDTPKEFLYPSEKEKLLKEMEFGASATQYQYIPMGMPGVFRYKALVPLTRLQSWWMNYFTKFLREAIYRGFKGRPSWSGEDGPTLPWSRRINFLKYVIIGGAILTSLGYKKSFMLGVAPTYLSPAGQLALGMYNYATAKEDWQRKRALNQIYYSWRAFIPGSLAWRDFLAVWKGEKELNEILFYGKEEVAKPSKKVSTIEFDWEKETKPKSVIKFNW